MSFSVDVLAKIAIELQTGIGHQDRFQRLISTLRHVLDCDASALLRYEDGSLFRWPSTGWRRTCSATLYAGRPPAAGDHRPGG